MNTNTASLPSLPLVGTPAAYQVGSDRYPVTVVHVSKSGHRIVAQHAACTRVPGTNHMDQKVTFDVDPSGALVTFTRRQDGRYRMVGCESYGTLRLGQYDRYIDPSF